MTSLWSVAILADIHGNIWALDAVLADLDRRGVTQIVDLGDTVYGPFAPRETAQRLQERHIVSVRGNCDRAVYEPETEASPSLHHTRTQLTSADLDWLRAFPATRVVADALLLCHGTPTADDAYLLEVPTPQGSCLQSLEMMSHVLHDIPYPVICCAHSHIPRIVRTATHQLVVNPGSVGMPAYRDGPCPMETGSPHARYAIVHQQQGAWSVEQVAIPYEWEAAAICAEQLGQSDRAYMQRTGYVPRSS